MEGDLYCYKVMLVDLKNVGATYQHLINKMFVDQIGRRMDVYVDDMLLKSLKSSDHTRYMEETFHILTKYHMKLDPNKCVFGVGSEKFLGFMFNYQGIEANPQKIQAVLDVKSP